MAYIYCDNCGVGFHSNVYTCPECGRPARFTYARNGNGHSHRNGWLRHSTTPSLREDVESEVREEIYGWRSGTVELRRKVSGATSAAGEKAVR